MDDPKQPPAPADDIFPLSRLRVTDTPQPSLNALRCHAQEDDDWGCEYCRNDGKLTDNGTCPKCDALWDDDEPTAVVIDADGVRASLNVGGAK